MQIIFALPVEEKAGNLYGSGEPRVAGRRVAHNSAAMVPAGCGELAGRALLAGDHASGGALEALSAPGGGLGRGTWGAGGPFRTRWWARQGYLGR